MNTMNFDPENLRRWDVLIVAAELRLKDMKQSISRFKTMKEEGLSAFSRWSMIFNCPPLTITEPEIQEALQIVDHTLSKLDKYYEG